MAILLERSKGHDLVTDSGSAVVSVVRRETGNSERNVFERELRVRSVSDA